MYPIYTIPGVYPIPSSVYPVYPVYATESVYETGCGILPGEQEPETETATEFPTVDIPETLDVIVDFGYYAIPDLDLDGMIVVPIQTYITTKNVGDLEPGETHAIDISDLFNLADANPQPHQTRTRFEEFSNGQWGPVQNQDAANHIADGTLTSSVNLDRAVVYITVPFLTDGLSSIRVVITLAQGRTTFSSNVYETPGDSVVDTVYLCLLQ